MLDAEEFALSLLQTTQCSNLMFSTDFFWILVDFYRKTWKDCLTKANCKFLSDEFETVFWESETLLQNLSRWSLLCWELCRKCFPVFSWLL